MPSTKQLNVRMRRVCLELRRLRRAADFTLEQVANRIGLATSTVSRLEAHGMGLSRDVLIELLVVYRVPKEARKALLRLYESADQPGLLDRGDLQINDDTETWAGFEGHATVIRNFQQMLVPGLLQTFPYAHAVISSFGQPLSEQEIDDRVAARIARQALLRRRYHPSLVAIVHEAALREVVGGPEVMRGQLVHLAEINKRWDISVRVLPFESGAHPGMTGPFVVMDYENLPSLVMLENLSSDLYLEEDADIEAYNLAWQGIEAAALTPVDSVELIMEIAERLG